MKIKCPYCFEEFNDDEVHFRVKSMGDPKKSPLNPKYEDDIDKYRATSGDSEDEIKRIEREYSVWERESSLYKFCEGTYDEKYVRFWVERGRAYESVESSPRIIDPNNNEHHKFLIKQPSGKYYTTDIDGMANGVVLINGTTCNQRVCKHCHNPLPNTYGKAETRFISVIGTQGSGKTVFLSRLVENIDDYASSVGLTFSPVANVDKFLESHRITEDRHLPDSTVPLKYQMPLIFDIQIGTGYQTRRAETLVLYDLAGEFFTNRKLEKKINVYCKCIHHCDGMIFLIEPKQFKYESFKPTEALITLHNVIQHNARVKYEKPMAVCISQCDDKDFKDVFGNELYNKLIDNREHYPSYEYLEEQIREYFLRLYEIQRRIKKVILSRYQALDTNLKNNYANYSYFAFSSLRNGVKESMPVLLDEGEWVRDEQRRKNPSHLRNNERQFKIDRDFEGNESLADATRPVYQDMHKRVTGESGKSINFPNRPIISKHIEDPLLWLLYCLRYYSSPIPMYSVMREVYCVNSECRSDYTYPLDTVETIVTIERNRGRGKRSNKSSALGLMGKLFGEKESETTRRVKVNYCCAKCGKKFYYACRT